MKTAEHLIDSLIESDDLLSTVKEYVAANRFRAVNVYATGRYVTVTFKSERVAHKFYTRAKLKFVASVPRTISDRDPKFKGWGGSGGAPQVTLSAVIITGEK